MPRKHADTLAVIDMIAAERIRQMEAEGFSKARDDQYQHGELARAAGCYALNVGKATAYETQHAVQLSRAQFAASPMPADWPWAGDWWKPYTPLQDLVRAAALIVADIERLLRQRTHPSFRPAPQLPPPPSASEVAALLITPRQEGLAKAADAPAHYDIGKLYVSTSRLPGADDAYTADRRFMFVSLANEGRAILEGNPTDLRARLAETCAKAGFSCRFLPARSPGSLTLTLAAPPLVDLKAAMDAIAAQGFCLLDRVMLKDHADPAICARVAIGGGTAAQKQAQEALEDC